MFFLSLKSDLENYSDDLLALIENQTAVSNIETLPGHTDNKTTRVERQISGNSSSSEISLNVSDISKTTNINSYMTDHDYSMKRSPLDSTSDSGISSENPVSPLYSDNGSTSTDPVGSPFSSGSSPMHDLIDEQVCKKLITKSTSM